MKQICLMLAIILFFGGIVNSQSCKDLPEKFYSYTEAINAIQDASFKSIDKLPYGKSSWIISATYYTCDGVSGYLVYTTDKGKEYVHEKVPVYVWMEFKNANSSGSYYVQNIKGRYRLVPNSLN